MTTEEISVEGSPGTDALQRSAGRVALEYLPSGVALLRLGPPGERVVTITAQRMESLREAVLKLKAERPRGVIISGSGPEMFTAGADINLIRGVTDPAVGEKLAREGQRVFDEIAALPCPTIAAISGPCVGGGCELALACGMRIISDHKSSLIGLPEIKLGILPGFGGTQRLPRLVGLPKALDVILAGKTLRPRQALKIGLVDEIVTPEKVIERANAILSGTVSGKRFRPGIVDRFLTFTSFGRGMVRKKAQRSVQRETRGFYPAPPAALEAALLGLERGMTAGLDHEARELGRLIVTPESKALVRIFFLTENAKGIGKSGRKAVEHVQAVVIGSGVMGAGIAGVLARSECGVILKDTTDENLSRGIAQIKKYLESMRHLSDQERSFVLNRIELTTSHSSNTGNANFAVEAIFEDLTIKKKVLAEVSQLMPQDAIIASNTSSLSITEISRAIKNPERVVGMHFFNPVPKMPLVEIVRGAETSDRTVAVVAALTSKIGKYPIVVKDVPGFLINRILTPYLNEAAFLMSDFDVKAIDQAALEFGMPMGPLRLLDEVGLDVAAHVSEIMINGYGERMRGPGYAALLNAAERKGKKSGAGFYDFAEDSETEWPELRKFLKLPPLSGSADRSAIRERLIMALINEAVLCLDEGVAGKPGPEAAQQIDLGTVMGMGFPPFRGGLLCYADSLGAARILESLRQLEQRFGSRFSPAPGIERRARGNEGFSQQERQ